jgi:hypothetical protein
MLTSFWEWFVRKLKSLASEKGRMSCHASKVSFHMRALKRDYPFHSNRSSRASNHVKGTPEVSRAPAINSRLLEVVINPRSSLGLVVQLRVRNHTSITAR